ncbi:MAG: hypothetical protein PHQ74_15245 [Crocinitomicaceae bacterium]|nr:hypothetical protein [Crocinitomicaceae bacterium]
MYNALRGYSDVSRIVVPGAINDKMIGFNKSGQTKVWVNENFGMNHPGNHHSDATLDEAVLLNNLVNAVSSKLDLTPDFLNGVKNSRSIGNALNFIRANSGVTESVLENNQVNVANYTGKSQVPVLRDTTPVQNVIPQTTSTFVQPTSFVQQPQPVYYQPPVGQQVIQSGYRNQPASFVQPSGPSYVQPSGPSYVQPTGTTSAFVGNGSSFQSGYQVPRYVESVGPNKFSFTTAQ